MKKGETSEEGEREKGEKLSSKKGREGREDLLLGERISTGSCMSFFHGVEIYGLLKLLLRRKHICF